MLSEGATALPSFGEREGRHLVLGGHPMLIVGTDPVEVERLLRAGELACSSCGGALTPWGHARERSSRGEGGTVRHRPRRARCGSCGRTHVLLPERWLLRRADAAAVIGAALEAKAAGAGHRPIAAALGRPVTTVRGWLRRFTARAEETRVGFTGGVHPEPSRLLCRLQAGCIAGWDAVFAA